MDPHGGDVPQLLQQYAAPVSGQEQDPGMDQEPEPGVSTKPKRGGNSIVHLFGFHNDSQQ
jgi:hypothetical protein